MEEIKYQPKAPIPREKIMEGGDTLNFIRPDGRSRCTWTPGCDNKVAPHSFLPHRERSEICANVLHAVGNTPLIRLNNIPKSLGIKCEMCKK